MLWIESGRGRPTIALVVAFALAACAGGAPAPTPAEFPLHATEQQFYLSWGLALSGDRAVATGVVARRNGEISDAWLQLVGLDAAGHIVSFSGLSHVRWASPWDAEPFTLELRPRGEEQRFEVRVKSFLYQEGAPTKG